MKFFDRILTINLEKKLSKLALERERKEEKYLTQSPAAREYFNHKNIDDDEILSRFGTSRITTDIDETLKNILSKKEKHSSEDLRKIFKTSDIENICINYNLRFHPIARYTGGIDAFVPSTIRTFETSEIYKDLVLTLDSRTTYGVGTYRIVAPVSSFDHIKNNEDPLLFCYLGNGEWYFVCKWGTNLQTYRKIQALFFNNTLVFGISINILLSILITFISMTTIKIFDLQIIAIVIPIIISIVAHFIFALQFEWYDYNKIKNFWNG